ncbi:hypothetical protein QTO34_014996 [Cnephaeus nilssonii]|uniref:RNase H type-1 domain-containing protein n=1 Tax=Cnephaeus nilssonii TaxID=3371016 RepID=A0AA40HA75_CNENI|nr:hypothetical protein QTO34_014996 [Eptesicus nilssonii]
MQMSPGLRTEAASYRTEAVTETDTVWAEALPSGTSAQRAELVALTKALTLGVGRQLNINTDSRYAFTTAHVHGAIYHERGLLIAEGQTIKNKQEILDLLSAYGSPPNWPSYTAKGTRRLTTQWQEETAGLTRWPRQ